MRIAVILLFIFSWGLPAFSAVPAQKDSKDAIQTHISNPIPFNAPSEHPHTNFLIAKVFFVVSSFLPEQLLDLPSQEITNSPAIFKNSYQHNVFYVTPTSKAP